MFADSIEKLNATVTFIRYESLKAMNHPDQFIHQNFSFLATKLGCQYLLEEVLEAAQKKLKLAYELSYNSLGFFSETAFPDLEHDPIHQASGFPDLMEEDINAFSFESWPG